MSEENPLNGLPALTPSMLPRIQRAWVELEEAKKDFHEKHQADQESRARLEKKREEFEGLFRSLFESRPLFDALEEGDGNGAAVEGLTLKQLRAALISEPKVKPITLCGRPHVAVALSGTQGIWFLRPLWGVGAFTTKYPKAELKDHPDLSGDALGVKIQIGRVEYVVGSKAEERRLDVRERQGAK